MLREEWLQIGYDKGIIDDIPESEFVNFETVYKMWFKSKMGCIRPQSLDRIEVTYNRYYCDTEFVRLPVHTINEAVIYKFINGIILEKGNITEKELSRIEQIVRNVMSYGFDLNIGYSYCVNWNVVKRFLAVQNLRRVEYKELCVSSIDRSLFASSIFNGIYSQKQSACLCLLLNFYLGLRVGELAGLTWNSVDIEKGLVYVRGTEVKAYHRNDAGERCGGIKYDMQDTTKTACGVRIVPLVNESKYILVRLREWHETKGYYHPSQHLAYDGGDTILSKSLERTLRRVCRLCDIPEFNTHRIRKTFATELHNSGVPTKVISDLMGHAEIRTTERNYIISTPESMDIVRSALSSVSMVTIPAGGTAGINYSARKGKSLAG